MIVKCEISSSWVTCIILLWGQYGIWCKSSIMSLPSEKLTCGASCHRMVPGLGVFKRRLGKFKEEKSIAGYKPR